MKTILLSAFSLLYISGFGQYLDFDESQFPMRFESSTCYASRYDTLQKKMVFQKKQDCNLVFSFLSKNFISVNNETYSCFRLINVLSDAMVDGTETRLYDALDQCNARCVIAILFNKEKKDISIKVIYPLFSILYTAENLEKFPLSRGI